MITYRRLRGVDQLAIIKALVNLSREDASFPEEDGYITVTVKIPIVPYWDKIKDKDLATDYYNPIILHEVTRKNLDESSEIADELAKSVEIKTDSTIIDYLDQ